jgi:hypothetical protein
MRGQGKPKKTGLPDVVFAIMQAIVYYGGYANKYQVAADSGYSLGSVNRMIFSILDREWAYSPYNGLFGLTERGKLVLAIETGRRTKARSRQLFYRKQTFVKFEIAAKAICNAHKPRIVLAQPIPQEMP